MSYDDVIIAWKIAHDRSVESYPEFYSDNPDDDLNAGWYPDIMMEDIVETVSKGIHRDKRLLVLKALLNKGVKIK
jgi:hypothetical protein